MPLADAALSALLNVIILAGIPFLCYFSYHKLRHKRTMREIAERAGLQLGEVRYLGYSLAAAAATVAVIILWPPPLESFLHERSPQHTFVGLGLSGQAMVMALLYGVVKTGFSEELLFRGLIAGSLGRRLPLVWANLLQALIFLLPHVPIILLARELWWVLLIVFAGSLFTGWIRIASGSILGPWLIHAAANVTMCLSVAARTVT